MDNSYERPPTTPKVPEEFLKRRLQSLFGLFIVFFLFEHLLTNSQAALFFGNDGRGFIDSVDLIHDIPYLHVLEIALLGVPILGHAFLGINRIRTAKLNTTTANMAKPKLSYTRNHFFSWQRITAIFLIFAIFLHVAFMRFYRQPEQIIVKDKTLYTVQVSSDPGLYSVTKRLGITLLKNGKESFIQTDSIGKALLLVVRDTFKSPTLCVLYSLFVFFTAFHAANGLWTFFIVWGITLSERSRIYSRICCYGLFFLFLFFGLSAIWGTYWINLYR